MERKCFRQRDNSTEWTTTRPGEVIGLPKPDPKVVETTDQPEISVEEREIIAREQRRIFGL